MATRARVLVGRKKAKSNKPKRNQTKRHGHYVSMAEQTRMCQEYLLGGSDNSITKIAKRFGRDIMTVSRIVQSEEMEEIALRMKKAILANSSEKIVERIDYEVATKKSKAGAWIAMDLAERIGAIPPKISRSMMWGAGRMAPSSVEKPEDEQVKDWIMKLTEVTMERGRVFGMPMPELDEFKDEIEIPVHKKKA